MCHGYVNIPGDVIDNGDVIVLSLTPEMDDSLFMHYLYSLFFYFTFSFRLLGALSFSQRQQQQKNMGRYMIVIFKRGA